MSAPPDLSAAIEKIMQNPELITMVASALGGQPSRQEQTDADAAEEAAEQEKSEAALPPSDVMTSLAPMLSRLSSLGSQGAVDQAGVRHAQLLCALKPYVAPARQEAIDYILKISQMSVLLKGLK